VPASATGRGRSGVRTSRPWRAVWTRRDLLDSSPAAAQRSPSATAPTSDRRLQLRRVRRPMTSPPVPGRRFSALQGLVPSRRVCAERDPGRAGECAPTTLGDRLARLGAQVRALCARGDGGSLMLRVRLARAMYMLVMVPLSLLSGSGVGGSDERSSSNGVLVLASRRDLRSEAGRHLARRLDTPTWIVYLFGVRVLVDWGQHPRRLLDDRRSVLGEIEAVDGTKDLYHCRLAGGNSAPFFLFRRRQLDERRTSPFARG
jgi:hypothetical protein